MKLSGRSIPVLKDMLKAFEGAIEKMLYLTRIILD